jgi:hypothetical protein
MFWFVSVPDKILPFATFPKFKTSVLMREPWLALFLKGANMSPRPTTEESRHHDEQQRREAAARVARSDAADAPYVNLDEPPRASGGVHSVHVLDGGASATADLARILGDTRIRTTDWMEQRTRIVNELTDIHNLATDLLQQLGVSMDTSAALNDTAGVLDLDLTDALTGARSNGTGNGAKPTTKPRKKHRRRFQKSTSTGAARSHADEHAKPRYAQKRTMSPKARKAHSRRMKKFWADRRAEKKAALQ